MRLPWPKRNRSDADTTAAYEQRLREVLNPRSSKDAGQYSLSDFIDIGNRDIGIEQAPQAPRTQKPDPELAASHDDNDKSPEVRTEASLSELSTEELLDVLLPSRKKDDSAA